MQGMGLWPWRCQLLLWGDSSQTPNRKQNKSLASSPWAHRAAQASPHCAQQGTILCPQEGHSPGHGQPLSSALLPPPPAAPLTHRFPQNPSSRLFQGLGNTKKHLQRLQPFAAAQPPPAWLKPARLHALIASN